MDTPDYAPDDFKCATFDPAIRAKITPEIRAKMDADRAKARAELAARKKSEPRQCEHADVPRSQCGCPESGPCLADPDNE